MSESKPKSGPSQRIIHGPGKKTTFVERKTTPKYTRTQVRTYAPRKK